MRATLTTYRLARLQDFRRLKQMAGLEAPLSQPTVLAEREGKMLGFLGTWKNNGHLVAGPLHIETEGQGRAIIAFRLIEAYEVEMRRRGTRAYLFAIEKGNGIPWIALLAKMKIEPYADDGERVWYQRVLVAQPFRAAHAGLKPCATEERNR